MDSLLEQYGITPAKYYGGKLNGVDCHEVMSHAKNLLDEIEALLLSVLHTDGAMMLSSSACVQHSQRHIHNFGHH
jgi:hypothetical protein